MFWLAAAPLALTPIELKAPAFRLIATARVWLEASIVSVPPPSQIVITSGDESETV